MLILTRRPNETLCIANDIRITVLSVNGAQVRLGIQAPRFVAVDREESYQRKQAEQGDFSQCPPRQSAPSRDEQEASGECG